MKIVFCASRRQNVSSHKLSDQSSSFLEHKYLQIFQGPEQQLQSKYINEVKGRLYVSPMLPGEFVIL